MSTSNNGKTAYLQVFALNQGLFCCLMVHLECFLMTWAKMIFWHKQRLWVGILKGRCITFDWLIETALCEKCWINNACSAFVTNFYICSILHFFLSYSMCFMFTFNSWVLLLFQAMSIYRSLSDKNESARALENFSQSASNVSSVKQESFEERKGVSQNDDEDFVEEDPRKGSWVTDLEKYGELARSLTIMKKHFYIPK